MQRLFTLYMWFFGALFFLIFAMILLGSAKGAGATIGQDGWLKWDFTGVIAREGNQTERERIRQQNETERERIRQMEQTERNEDNAQALQLIAIAGAAAGCIVVYVVQSNRTKRKALDIWIDQQWQRLPGPAAARQLPPVVNLYINYLIPGGQGQVIDVGGVPMIRDDYNRRLIPLDVAEAELSNARLLPPPPSRRLPGPTIDGA